MGRREAALTAAFCVLVTALGCTAADPFGQSARTPRAPSWRYRGPSDAQPFLDPPRVAPRPEAGPLSLAQCIYIALQNNPAARGSWQATLSAAASAGQARGVLLPQVDFTATAQRQKVQVLTEVEAEFLRTTYGANFGVRQLLLDGGARRAQIEAAEAALRTADFRHNATLLEVALQTEVAYYQFLTARALLEVAREALEQRTRHLQLAQRQFDAGLGRELEVYQARAEQADAELALVEASNGVRLARGQLASAMGLRSHEPLEVRQIPKETRPAERRDMDALLRQAAGTRPILKAAAGEIARLEQAVREQRAARWPELNAFVNYGYSGLRLLSEERDEYSLGLQMSLPIFTGFQRSYSIRRAEAELQRAIASYQGRLQGIELELWEAYSELLRTEGAIAAARAFVASARRSQEATENAYRAGKATIVELIDAQTTLTRARTREEAVTLEWHIAMARLERAVGQSWSMDAGEGERQPEPQVLPFRRASGPAETPVP